MCVISDITVEYSRTVFNAHYLHNCWRGLMIHDIGSPCCTSDSRCQSAGLQMRYFWNFKSIQKGLDWSLAYITVFLLEILSGLNVVYCTTCRKHYPKSGSIRIHCILPYYYICVVPTSIVPNPILDPVQKSKIKLLTTKPFFSSIEVNNFNSFCSQTKSLHYQVENKSYYSI